MQTAIDCLRRGFHSTRANWGLLPLKVLQDLLFTVLLLVSFLPPVVVLGGMALLDEEWSEATFQEWLLGLPDELAARLAPFALSVLASLVLGVLAVIVWGWFQGGLVGTLVAAERQAVPRAEDRTGGWRWFRTFSLRDFSGWGGRHVWRFFWFFHLAVTVSLLFVLLLVLLIFGAAMGQEAWGAGAAFGIGCGGSLPLLFLLVIYFLWFSAAQPAVALEGSGPVRGSVLGLRVVGRRLGGSFLVGLAVFVVAVTFGMGLGLTQAAVGMVLEERFAAWLVTYLIFTLIQIVGNAAITVYLLAAFTALVVAEAGKEPPEELPEEPR